MTESSNDDDERQGLRIQLETLIRFHVRIQQDVDRSHSFTECFALAAQEYELIQTVVLQRRFQVLKRELNRLYTRYLNLMFRNSFLVPFNNVISRFSVNDIPFSNYDSTMNMIRDTEMRYALMRSKMIKRRFRERLADWIHKLRVYLIIPNSLIHSTAISIGVFASLTSVDMHLIVFCSRIEKLIRRRSLTSLLGTEWQDQYHVRECFRVWKENVIRREFKSLQQEVVNTRCLSFLEQFLSDVFSDQTHPGCTIFPAVITRQCRRVSPCQTNNLIDFFVKNNWQIQNVFDIFKQIRLDTGVESENNTLITLDHLKELQNSTRYSFLDITRSKPLKTACKTILAIPILSLCHEDINLSQLKQLCQEIESAFNDCYSSVSILVHSAFQQVFGSAYRQLDQQLSTYTPNVHLDNHTFSYINTALLSISQKSYQKWFSQQFQLEYEGKAIRVIWKDLIGDGKACQYFDWKQIKDLLLFNSAKNLLIARVLSAKVLQERISDFYEIVQRDFFRIQSLLQSSNTTHIHDLFDIVNFSQLPTSIQTKLKNILVSELSLIEFIERVLCVRRIERSMHQKFGLAEQQYLSRSQLSNYDRKTLTNTLRFSRMVQKLFPDVSFLLQFANRPLSILESTLSSGPRGLFIDKKAIEIETLQAQLDEMNSKKAQCVNTLIASLGHIWRSIFELKQTDVVQYIKRNMVRVYSQMITGLIISQERTPETYLALITDHLCCSDLLRDSPECLQTRLTQEMAFFEKRQVNSTLTGLDVYQMSPEFDFVVQDPIERIKVLQSVNVTDGDERTLCKIIACHTSGLPSPRMHLYLSSLIQGHTVPEEYKLPKHYALLDQQQRLTLIQNCIVVDVENQSKDEIISACARYTRKYMLDEIQKSGMRAAEKAATVFDQWKSQLSTLTKTEQRKAIRDKLSNVVQSIGTRDDWVYVNNEWVQDNRKLQSPWIWSSESNRWILPTPESPVAKFTAETFLQYYYDLESELLKQEQHQEERVWLHLSKIGGTMLVWFGLSLPLHSPLIREFCCYEEGRGTTVTTRIEQQLLFQLSSTGLINMNRRIV